MVITQIRSLYRDENDLLRTVIKRVYETWDDALSRWQLKKIEFLFPADALPLYTDTPEASVEHQHGWIVPPAWAFVSEVREYERKPEDGITYDPDAGAVQIIR